MPGWAVSDSDHSSHADTVLVFFHCTACHGKRCCLPWWCVGGEMSLASHIKSLSSGVLHLASHCGCFCLDYITCCNVRKLSADQIAQNMSISCCVDLFRWNPNCISYRCFKIKGYGSSFLMWSSSRSNFTLLGYDWKRSANQPPSSDVTKVLRILMFEVTVKHETHFFFTKAN